MHQVWLNLMFVAGGKWVFEFSVKFYPPEPYILQEEITRSVLVVHKFSFCCRYFLQWRLWWPLFTVATKKPKTEDGRYSHIIETHCTIPVPLQVDLLVGYKGLCSWSDKWAELKHGWLIILMWINQFRQPQVVACAVKKYFLAWNVFVFFFKSFPLGVFL